MKQSSIVTVAPVRHRSRELEKQNDLLDKQQLAVSRKCNVQGRTARASCSEGARAGAAATTNDAVNHRQAANPGTLAIAGLMCRLVKAACEIFTVRP
jgi:hypothetical protein